MGYNSAPRFTGNVQDGINHMADRLNQHGGLPQ